MGTCQETGTVATWDVALESWGASEATVLGDVCHELNVQVSGTNPCSWAELLCSGEASAVGVPPWQYVITVHFSETTSSKLVPAVGRLTGLRGLELSEHDLDLPIPKEIGRLNHLISGIKIILGSLPGCLPTQLGSLPAVADRLLLELCYPTGPLPTEIGRLYLCGLLYLLHSHLDGNLPSELGKFVGQNGVPVLFNLCLWEARWTGTIPSEFGCILWKAYLLVPGNSLTGPCPSQLGNHGGQKRLSTENNKVTGVLPTELGQLGHELSVFGTWNNQYAGSLLTQLGWVTNLAYLHFFTNRYEGQIPDEIFNNCTNPTTIRVNDNLLFGSIPSMARLQRLFEVTLSLNRLSSALHLPYCESNEECPDVLSVLASDNHILALPVFWYYVSRISVLTLNTNSITSWQPAGVYEFKYSHICTYKVLAPCFGWTQIKDIGFSNNPIRFHVRDVLMSLTYLSLLTVFGMSGSMLTGSIPIEHVSPFYAVLSNSCAGQLGVEGMPSIVRMYLDNNMITAFSSPAPSGLLLLSLSSNMLTTLHEDVFRGAITKYHDSISAAMFYGYESSLVDLDITTNYDLHMTVSPPSKCLDSPDVSMHGANSERWSLSGIMYETASLCVSAIRVMADVRFLNASSLCRCVAGTAGRTITCTSCPQDTFSTREAGTWSLVATCERCPPQMSTDGVKGSMDESACHCIIGFFDNMGGRELSCAQCPVHSTTESTGASLIQECACKPETLARKIGDACGCVDGQFMNQVDAQCLSCGDGIECFWQSNASLSLTVPPISSGFWSKAYPVAYIKSFSSHNIFRCFSFETCMVNNKCVVGRKGTACSLCMQQHYGGPDGSCRECAMSRYAMLIVACVVSVILLLVLSGLKPLVSKPYTYEHKNGRPNTEILGSCLKQLIKNSQILAVLMNCQVDWPEDSQSAISLSGFFGSTMKAETGVACLSDEQTAELELSFMWAIPLALLLLSYPARLFSNLLPKPEMFSIDIGAHTRIFFLVFGFLFLPVTQTSLVILNCRRNPNGEASVFVFAHVECGSSSWVALLPFSVGALLMYSISFLVVNIAVVHIVVNKLVTSGGQEQGPWCFAFPEFRSVYINWAAFILLRDVMYNATPVVFAADGSSQTVLVALLFSLYGLATCLNCPHLDQTCGVIETWMSFGVACLAVFVSSFGFVTSDSMGQQLEGATETSAYKLRSLSLLVIIFNVIGCPILMTLNTCAMIVGDRFFTDNSTAMSHKSKCERDIVQKCMSQEYFFHGLDSVEFTNFSTVVKSSMASLHIAQPVRPSAAACIFSVGSKVRRQMLKTTAAKNTDRRKSARGAVSSVADKCLSCETQVAELQQLVHGLERTNEELVEKLQATLQPATF